MHSTIHRRGVSWAIRVLSLALTAAPVALAQAWVELDTPTTRLITNQVNGLLISGDCHAEILHGPAEATDDQLVSTGGLISPSAGRLNALRRTTLGNYRVGDRIRFLVRVWFHENNRYKSYAEAAARGSSGSWLSDPVLAVAGDPVPLTIKLDGMPLFSVRPHVAPEEFGRAIIPVGPSLPSRPGSGGNVTFHGLTADGNAHFYRSEAFSGEPAGYSTSVSHELSDDPHFPFRTFARQDSFYPFPDPNFPSEPTSTPAWSVPAMTSDGSLAIGTRQSGSVSNVFLIRGGELIPLPLVSALGLSGDGVWAFGIDTDRNLVRHRRLQPRTDTIAPPPPAGRQFRIVAASQTGNACLIGTGSTTSESLQYWRLGNELVQLPPTNSFRPVCLSPDGLTLGGSMRTNGHTVAARWTLTRGVERIGPLDCESAIGGLSFDGSVLGGETWLAASPSDTEPMIWMADGTAHKLRDLVPRFTRDAVDARNVFGMSHDGRAVGLHNGTFGHIIRFTLPNERFAIDLRHQPDSGAPALGFHGLRGVGYTIERQLPDGTWTVASPETEGLDAWREWTPETTDDHGLFRVTARSL